MISLEELQLAARNHGMPLEALRHEITPVGLHYLLIHYDIPFVDGATWALHVDGNVERTLTLSLDELAEWVRGQSVEIESEPQEYTYMPGYYAFFFFDPDGIKLEVVHVPGLVAA